MGEQHSDLLALSTQAAPELLVLLLGFDGPAVQQAAYQALAAAASSESLDLSRAAAQLAAHAQVQQQVVVHGLSSAAVRQQAAQLLQAAVASPGGRQALAPWSPWLACYAAEADVGAAVSGVLAQLQEDRYCRLNKLSKLAWLQAPACCKAQPLTAGLLARAGGNPRCQPGCGCCSVARRAAGRVVPRCCRSTVPVLRQQWRWWVEFCLFKLGWPTLLHGHPPGHPLLQLEGRAGARLALDPFQGLLDGGAHANFFSSSSSQYVQSFR